MNFNATKRELIVYGTSSANVTQQTFATNLNGLLASYTDPVQVNRGGVQAPAVFADKLAGFTDGAPIQVSSQLDLGGNSIVNLTSSNDPSSAVRKSYVDSISAGDGLAKSAQMQFSVKLNANSLEFDGAKNVQISATALSTGLDGGSGLPIRVISDQSQVTKVGTLLDLTVDGKATFKGTADLANSRIVNVAPPSALKDAVNLQTSLQLLLDLPATGLSSTGDTTPSLLNPRLHVNVDDFSIGVNQDNQLYVSPNFLGAGLTGAGGAPISVTEDLPHVRSLGPLLSLQVLGTSTFQSTVDSTTFSNGATTFLGGVGMSKRLNVAGAVSFSSTLNMNSTKIINLADPTNTYDAVTKHYVDSVVSTAGIGLAKTDTTFDVLTDASSIEISPTNRLRVSAVGLGTGLTGGSGDPISVIANQSQITQIGTLVDLDVQGAVTFGADFDVTGAVSLTSTLTVGGQTTLNDQVTASSLAVTNQTTLHGLLNVSNNRIVNVATPTASTDVANRAYVDSLVPTPDLGLVKSGNAFSVKLAPSLEIDASNRIDISSGALDGTLTGGSGSPISVAPLQPQITTVGMLSSLAVNGLIMAYSGLNVNNSRITNLGIPTSPNDATSKTYVDSNRPTAGSALSKSNATTDLNVNVDGSSIEISPANALRLSASGLSSSLVGGSGDLLATSANQSHVTQVGTLVSLSVSGAVNFTSSADATSTTSGPFKVAGGISVAQRAFIGGAIVASSTLTVADTANFSGNANVTGRLEILNAEQSTDLASGALRVTGGAFVAKNFNVGGSSSIGMSLTVGSSFKVNSTTDSTSTVTGAVVIGGGIGLIGSIFSGGKVSAVGGFDANLASLVNLPLPTAGHHATNKTYVDSLIPLAGTGLTKTGQTFSVNASQTQITQIGTLSSLSVSGASTFTGAVTVPTPSAGTSPTTKTYVDAISYITAGLGISKTSQTLAVTSTLAHVTSLGTLTSLTSSGNVRITANTVATSTSSGALAITGGFGVSGASYFGGILDVGANRIVNLGAPLAGTDAINKNYLEDRLANVRSKDPVTAATTGPVTIADIVPNYIMDGVTLIAGERVLLKDQVDAKTNGIYLVQATGPPTRTSDFQIGQVVSGSQVYVEGGTVNGSAGFTVANPNAPADIVVGTDNLLFGQFTGAGQLVAGLGIVKTANQLAVASTLGHVTALGTLTSLVSAGAVSITDSTVGTSATTGALVVTGTIGASALFLANNLSVGTTATFVGRATFSTNLTIPLIPTATTDATSKSYVDSLVVTASTGLTKTGTALSVNASQPQITQVGTLTTLTVTGALVGSTGSYSGNVSAADFLIGGNSVATQLYVTTQLSAYTNTTQLNALLSAKENNLTFVGASRVGNTVTVDFGAVAGTGLTYAGSKFNVNASQSQITSLGTLSSLTVVGQTTLKNSSSQQLMIAHSSSSIGSESSIFYASKNDYSLNATASWICGQTSGTFFFQSVTSTSSGNALVVTPFHLGGHVTAKGDFYANSNQLVATQPYVQTQLSAYSTTVQVNAQLALKEEILTFVGATRVGNTVTIVTDLSNYAGQVFINNATDSTSTSTGALKVLGGAGIGANLFVGGNLTFSGSSGDGVLTNGIKLANKISIAGQSSNADSTRMLLFSNSDVTWKNNECRIENSALDTATTYTSTLRLFYQSSIGRSNQASLFFTAKSGDCAIQTTNAPLKIETASNTNQIVANIDGTVMIGSNVTSTSTTSGALQVLGGVGIVGPTFTGGLATFGANIAVTGTGSFTGGISCVSNSLVANGFSTTLRASSSLTASYSINLPPSAPTTSGQYMAFESGGTSTFATLPIAKVYAGDGTTSQVGLKAFTVTVTTIGGKATVYATSDGTASGTAIFTTSVNIATAMPQLATTDVYLAPWASLHSISGDRKTIIFNVMTAVNLQNAGSTVLPAPDGTVVNVLAFGL